MFCHFRSKIRVWGNRCYTLSSVVKIKARLSLCFPISENITFMPACNSWVTCRRAHRIFVRRGTTWRRAPSIFQGALHTAKRVFHATKGPYHATKGRYYSTWGPFRRLRSPVNLRPAGGGCLNTPPCGFSRIARKRRRAAPPGFHLPYPPSFWQLLWKFRSWVMQGQVTRSGQVTIPYKNFTIAPQLQCSRESYETFGIW